MRYWILSILLIVSLSLAACGGAEQAAPTATEAPTLEPTPEPADDTVTDTETNAETSEFVAEGVDGASISLMVPAGWLAAGNADDGVIVSTGPDAGLTDNTFPSGEASVTVMVIAQEILDLMQIEAGTDAAEVLSRFMEVIGNAEGERPAPTLGDIQERMMSDGNGAYAFGSSEQMDMITIIMPVGERYALISAMTASGELSDFEETFFRIAESMIYQAGE